MVATNIGPHRLCLWLGERNIAQALLLALLAGSVASFGFAPVATVAAPILAIALLLLLLNAQPAGRAFVIGLAFGFAQMALGLDWLAEAFQHQSAMPPALGWLAVALLALYLGLYPGLASWLARRATAQLVPLVLIWAALFTLGEMARGWLFTGFPWNPLGVAWLQLPGVAGLAAVIGANGLSALLVLAGGSLAALIGGRGEARRLTLVLVFPFLLLFGLLVPRLQQPLPPGPGTSLLLVQTGVGVDDKHADGGAALSLATALQETRAALPDGPAPAAVIWPEAAISWPLEAMPELRHEVTRDLPPATLLLTGGISEVTDENGALQAVTNSLYALDARGRILARYDKAHLVPGGEYLPLRPLAERLGLQRLVPGSIDFQPGPGPRTLDLPGLPAMGPDICYEIVFPGAVVDRHHRPAFMLTISNDGWFGASGPPQHFAQARLRAIEEGLPVVRATVTGISGVIDARGGVTALLPQGQAAGARVTLPAAAPATPFSRLGLWAPCLFATLLLLLGVMVRRMA